MPSHTAHVPCWEGIFHTHIRMCVGRHFVHGLKYTSLEALNGGVMAVTELPPLPIAFRRVDPYSFYSRWCLTHIVSSDQLAEYDLNRYYADSRDSVCTPLHALLSLFRCLHEGIPTALDTTIFLQNLRTVLESGADPNRALEIFNRQGSISMLCPYSRIFCPDYPVARHPTLDRLRRTVLVLLLDHGLRFTTVSRIPTYTIEPVQLNVLHLAAVVLQRRWRAHRLLRRTAAATTLQIWWLKQYYNPVSIVCKRRIEREFKQLAREQASHRAPARLRPR